MKLNPPPLNPLSEKELEHKDNLSKKLKLVRVGQGIADSLHHGNLEQAFTKTIIGGMKLANSNPFVDPLTSPLELAGALKHMGIGTLGWSPETLFSTIDRMYFGWSEEKVGASLNKFHDTGVIQTDVPPLVRQKIYAIRIVATSDTVHNEWHIFEKVGAAFNDRLPKFGMVEKLTPGECARTIAIIENIRPDSYADEVKAYIAASAHEDGILTLSDSKYLRMANSFLRQMNQDSMGIAYLPSDLDTKISKKLEILRSNGGKIEDEDVVTIQALKLMVIDYMGDEAVR